MAQKANQTQGGTNKPKGTSRMPENSNFYMRIVPVLLVIFGIMMLALVLFAGAVLMGIVRF
jgi:hypothetical protein